MIFTTIILRKMELPLALLRKLPFRFSQRSASTAADPFWVIVRKEIADHVRSWRFIILVILIAMTCLGSLYTAVGQMARSEEHTSELQSRENLVCRLLLEKNKKS